MIATASSEEKRALALELGADVAIDPNEDDLKTALREANGGAKVDIVLEMAGGRVFDQSLRALAPFGRLVTYGRRPRVQRDLERRADRPQPGGHRLLARALLRPPRAWWPSRCRSCSGWSPRGDLRVVEGGEYGLSEARQRPRGHAGAEDSGSSRSIPSA